MTVLVGAERRSPPGAELVETHSAIILKYGDTALKIKKRVHLDFLDFRTLAARARACQREVELNRRLSPDVYLDAVTIAGRDGKVRDHGVLMRRMPSERCLETLIREGADVSSQIRAIARLLTRFHAACRRSAAISAEAGPIGLSRRWRDNLDETLRFCGAPLDPAVHEDVRRLALRFLDGRGALFSARDALGALVDGHGDLIAADIYCLDDGPRILDCIEFDDRLRYVDVLDDVAFLAMDLAYLGRPDLGQHLLDGYAEFSGIPVTPSLVDHYVAYRAFVRAKVACLRWEQGVASAAGDARRHAELARAHLRNGEVTLCLVGGAPGTGKTTLGGQLADRMAAVLVSSDVVRQELAFPPDVRYSELAKEAVYDEMVTRARRLLSCGESVVLDATWSRTAQRQWAVKVAAETFSKLVELECRAPVEVAAARAERRRGAAGVVSEAGGSVARTMAADRDAWSSAAIVDTTQDDSAALLAALTAVAAA